MSHKKTFNIAVRQFDPFERALEKMWASFSTETGCDLALYAHPMNLHNLYDDFFRNF